MVHFKRKSEPILSNNNNVILNQISPNIGRNINNNNSNNSNNVNNESTDNNNLSRSTGIEKPMPPPVENKPKRPLSFSVFTLSPPPLPSLSSSPSPSNGSTTPPMTPNKINQSPNSSMSNFSSPNSSSLPTTPPSINGLSKSSSSHQFKMPPKSNSVIYSVVYDKTSSNLEHVEDDLYTRHSTQRLLLGRNKLTEVSERIGELTKLTTVDLSYNRLTNVPVSLSSLSDLTTLILTGNKFMIPATKENIDLQNTNHTHQPLATTSTTIKENEDEQVEKDDVDNNTSLPPPLSIVGGVGGSDGDGNGGEEVINVNSNSNSKICGGIPWELCYNLNLKKLDLGSNQSCDDNWTIDGGNILPSNLFWYTQIETLLIPFSQLLSISHDIQHLESLTHLDISNNSITELPIELGNLNYLTTLLANDNKIKIIPSEWTPDSYILFSIDSSLRNIDLSNNEIEIIPPNSFSNLIYLESLNLSNNLIKEIPSELCQGLDENLGLFSLKILKLRGNQISSLPTLFFTTCSNLKYLDLSFNNLNDLPIEGLKYLEQLSTLLLFNNNLTEIPNELFQGNNDNDGDDGDDDILPNLTNLNISGNRLKELPINIWKCKSLVNLSIGYNEITHIQFPSSLVLYSLEELYLNGNKDITFEFKNSPPDFPSLRELCLGSCNLKEIPIFCKDNLKSLEKFDLSNNNLKELPDWIGEFEHLLVLYLSRNQLTTLPYNEFKNLKNLIILDLTINNRLILDQSIYKILKDTSIITSPSLIDQSLLLLKSNSNSGGGSSLIGSSGEVVAVNNNSESSSSSSSPLSKSSQSVVFENSEKKPLDSNKHEIIMTKSKRFEMSFSDMIGRRPTMEDSFSIFGDFNGNSDGVESYDLISLFDGHAGSRAAIYSSEWFPKIMKSLMNKYPSLPPLQWLKQAYSEISLQFKIYIQNERPDLKYCGATAASLLITPDFYCVSNIGDTRIVLCKKGGVAQRLSFDHKPSDPGETKRISKLGGFVVSNQHTSRVNGTLAVSRSIGDIYMEPFVVPDPYLSQTSRNLDEDQYLIVACDGIWDEISDQQACNIVLNSSSTDEACTKLKDYAYFSGSDDNITVIVIKL